jgi:putative ABC transport system permease protein
MTTNFTDMSLIELSNWDLVAAASLILVNGAVSLLLKLRLERRLFIAAVRTVVQLLLIGLALEWVFRHGHWLTVTLLMVIMSLIAGVAAVNRTERRYPGIWFNSVVAVMASGWIVTLIALVGIIRPENWYRPQYAIPLMGMILGNALNGISLGLDRLGAELTARRDHVELRLTLGATRWEAARDAVQQAVRTGMIPMINSMMVVGLVSLPGMMTGQLLAGASPVGAVKYQIVIMFLIASATALGTGGAVLLSYLGLFNKRHQFLYGRISEKVGE